MIELERQHRRPRIIARHGAPKAVKICARCGLRKVWRGGMSMCSACDAEVERFMRRRLVLIRDLAGGR